MPEQETPPEGGNGDEFKPITSQEDLNRIIGQRVERERSKFADYDDLKTKAAEFDKVAEANKTEAQKAAERLEAAQAEKSALASENARLKAAIKHQLSPEDADALEGIPAERVDALAERLSKAAAAAQNNQKPPRRASPPGRASQEDDGVGRAAAALRALRQG